MKKKMNWIHETFSPPFPASVQGKDFVGPSQSLLSVCILQNYPIPSCIDTPIPSLTSLCFGSMHTVISPADYLYKITWERSCC